MSGTRVVGRVEAVYRYPVKSMAGERLEAVEVGWHGLDGDRRYALRRLEERGGFPWLSASKLPELIRYTPVWREGGLHVVTPEGRELPADGEELAAELARRHGKPLQMMRLKHGIFDEAAVSVISVATLEAIARGCGQAPDARRFRPNVVVRTDEPRPFEENDWVGAGLSFGADGPQVNVTLRDERCSMVNLDPDSARSDPEVMKTVVRLNQNDAGVYGTVTRRGTLSVGQPVEVRT